MPDKFNELLLKQDIIELYNAGITPDYGYLMNGRFEKDMIKALYPLKTLSGNPISWKASDTEYLFPVVSLEPKQEGSGDPSPENVRPISGYDSVTVTQSKDEAQVKQITLTLPETIYGGTVDAVTGAGNNETIMFELAIADMNSHENFPGWRAVTHLTDVVGVGHNATLNKGHFIACNITKSALAANGIGCFGVNTLDTNSVLYFPLSVFGLTQTQWKEQYPELVLQLCLKRISPEPFQATGNQALTIQPGNHTMYTDGNNISLSRKARRLEV